MKVPSLKVFIYFVVCSVLVHGASWAAETPKRVKLLVTSNIQGRGILDIKDQDTQDPLLILAQSILAEKEKGVDLYLDLGNGFYPGVISKFSSGSVMMDFFDFFSYASTLVSSKDLQIGLENLEFLQRNKRTQLLSANIVRDGKPIFTPYFVRALGGEPVAFIGLSSQRVEIDVAEKELYDISQENEQEVLAPILEELGLLGIKRIVLLSGLRLSITMRLMQAHKQIDMAVCGGDYTGTLFNGKISRIDLNDRRSVIMLDSEVDYFTIDLDLREGVKLVAMFPHQAQPGQQREEGYFEFRNRLSLWKQKYLEDQSRQFARTADKEYLLDDGRLLQLLRDRFNTEIAIVGKDTINPYPIQKGISQSDLLHLVNLDYKIFTFLLTGDQLSKITKQSIYDLEIAGLVREAKKIKVQGYPLDEKRRYSVAATQSAYRKIKQVLRADIDYENTWKTVSGLLADDLEQEQVILRDDYGYLEKRFRTLIDIDFSNYISAGAVDRGPTIETPVAQPSKNYNKWGLEDRIDITFYNQKHLFVLTPYVLYARQDDDYIQNLLRGIFLYEYNLSDFLKPYNKFQCDTVVESVEGQRPILIRETVGGSLYGEYFTGKIGLGFEKKVQDPTDDALYGFETILTFKYPFYKYFTYTFNIDNFVSTRDPDNDRWGLRSEIDNILSVRLNSYFHISLKYKYFYLYESSLDEDYRSSQIFTTLDLKTDWKFR